MPAWSVRFIQADCCASALAAQVVVAGVGDNAQKPGAEIALLEAGHGAVRLDHRLLHRVGSCLFGLQDLARHPLGSRPIEVDQAAKGPVVAETGSLEHAVGSCRAGLCFPRAGGTAVGLYGSRREGCVDLICPEGHILSFCFHCHPNPGSAKTRIPDEDEENLKIPGRESDCLPTIPSCVQLVAVAAGGVQKTGLVFGFSLDPAAQPADHAVNVGVVDISLGLWPDCLGNFVFA
jgi:hypothetical protein